QVVRDVARQVVVLQAQDLERRRVEALVGERLDDGEEDLLLAREVLVERARRRPRGGRDVGDARVEEAVALEDPLRRAHERRLRRLAARRPRARRGRTSTAPCRSGASPARGRPAHETRLSSQSRITWSASRLFFSIIIPCPFPCTPWSARRTRSTS